MHEMCCIIGEYDTKEQLIVQADKMCNAFYDYYNTNETDIAFYNLGNMSMNHTTSDILKQLDECYKLVYGYYMFDKYVVDPNVVGEIPNPLFNVYMNWIRNRVRVLDPELQLLIIDVHV